MDVTMIFGTLNNIVTGFIGILGNLFDGTDGLPTLFWNETTGLTLLGVLGLMALGYALTQFGFGFIKNLFKMKG